VKEYYSPELPPGFEEACEKYPDFQDDSLEDIWESLHIWQRHKQGWPNPNPKYFPYPFRTREEFLASIAKQIAAFKARILKAVENLEAPYIRALLKALQMPNHPVPLIDAVRATIEAFGDLFDETRQTKDQWPNKQQVERKKLRKARVPIPSERQWTRIFRKAGLWALAKAPRDRNQNG
jgi:hypothetical protein